MQMSTFYIQQFGCRATQADGAAIERQLLDRGCSPAPDPASAAIVVLNTCTVTAAADAQARDAIRKIHAQNPAARLIVTGCYAQRAPEELAALPGVSWVVGNSHKPQIPNLVTILAAASPSVVGAQHAAHLLGTTSDLLVGARHAGPGQFHSSELAQPTAPHLDVSSDSVVGARQAVPGQSSLNHHLAELPPSANILTGDIFGHPEFLSAPIQGGESGHTRPILKIQDGCNNRCSFCVIPFVRGKSRSLPPNKVVREIQALTGSGSREIVLSGINLGTYGRDLSPRVEFIDLLRRILDETSLERLRISSIEPQDVTQDLIELFASAGRIARHFHMPLQSGADRILAAMHRWYRSGHYARRIELIHDRLPNAAIGADVIAGFPGESESDHAATLAFIEEHPFTYLHVFSYSPRPGTKAASLPNQVPPQIIKRRARELRSLSESKSAAFRRSQIGCTLRVLTLRRNEDSLSDHAGAEYTPALSSNYLRVQIPKILASNLWLDVLIKSEEGSYLLTDAAPTSREISLTSVLCASSV